MLTLLQNVAVLGILGLAMAIVVIGRGIDLSLIAALAVPPGLVLQMVQDGHSLAGSLLAAWPVVDRLRPRQRLAHRLCRGAVAVCHACDRPVVAGLGQAALFQLDVVQWSPGMDGLRAAGPGHDPRHPDARS